MKILLFVSLAISAFFLLLSCSKEKSPIELPEKPEEETINEFVPGRVVVAYVTNYSSAVPDPNFVTHICYAFAEVYVVDGVYKKIKLEGTESRFKSIVDLKKSHPDLKILLSFTHVTDNNDNSQGGGFSAIAKSDEYRKMFASDCLEFIKQWGIDGIDLDWEFPGISWSGHASDPQVDVQNHVLLMKQLRETLGESYLLTYAGYIRDKQATNSGGYKYIDVSAVDPYIDFVNIMTYDMDEAPKAHNALRDSRAYWDCERAINAYIKAGVSPSKLVLGIPFYGRRSFSASPTAIKYNKIISLGSEYKIDNWDTNASVPYVTKNGVYYCSYDNAKSISIKGKWLLSKKMKGMMYWSYDGDDNKGTLRKAVWNAVMSNGN